MRSHLEALRHRHASFPFLSLRLQKYMLLKAVARRLQGAAAVAALRREFDAHLERLAGLRANAGGGGGNAAAPPEDRSRRRGSGGDGGGGNPSMAASLVGPPTYRPSAASLFSFSHGGSYSLGPMSFADGGRAGSHAFSLHLEAVTRRRGQGMASRVSAAAGPVSKFDADGSGGGGSSGGVGAVFGETTGQALLPPTLQPRAPAPRRPKGGSSKAPPPPPPARERRVSEDGRGLGLACGLSWR